MDVIQLLITIVVVTILVTIVLAIVTYVAYKLRLAREPSALGRPEDGPRYFVLHDPPTGSGKSEGDVSAAGSGLEGHATQA
ncbi:MAG TPA: hypothetical protein VMM35_12720 [Longimicrobiales bacterium]|nr:hypothetical protein [Longimicrobiales bacterium]